MDSFRTQLATSLPIFCFSSAFSPINIPSVSLSSLIHSQNTPSFSLRLLPFYVAADMSRAVLSTVLVASIKRRTFSTTVAAATRMETKAAESSPTASSTSKKSSSPASSSSWVPDPITGYYRPANKREEIDAAHMREKLFSHHKAQN